MIEIKVTEETKRKDGSLHHIQTIGFIKRGFEYLYDNSRKLNDGQHWIRLGTSTKYHRNGIIAWQLKYDEFGNSVPSGVINKREDGSNIKF